jgi:hypothetical protein
MITKTKNGFLSLDALISMVPIVMITAFVLIISAAIARESEHMVERQQLFDKLVSIADHSVNEGLAMKSTNTGDGAEGPFIHNYINESAITDVYTEGIARASGLSELGIRLDRPDNPNPYGPVAPVMEADICIYRLVVFGKNREISRLIVCGR